MLDELIERALANQGTLYQGITFTRSATGSIFHNGQKYVILISSEALLGDIKSALSLFGLDAIRFTEEVNIEEIVNFAVFLEAIGLLNTGNELEGANNTDGLVEEGEAIGEDNINATTTDTNNADESQGYSTFTVEGSNGALFGDVFSGFLG